MNSKVKNKAISLLARQEYSEKKLRDKLLLQFPEIEIQEVLNWLKDLNYLNDQRYQEMRVRGLLRKGKTPLEVLYKCQQDGLQTTMEDIKQVQNELQISDDQLLEQLISKKLKSHNTELEQKQILKMMRSLSQKGFHLDECQLRSKIESLSNREFTDF